MKVVKYFCIFVFVLLIFLATSVFSYSEKICNDLSNNIFRIHIIANSNSEIDQKTKYIVRDEIIKHFSKKKLFFSNINECIEYYENNINEINTIVNKVLDNSMDFKTSITNAYFPTKEYNNFSLPNGTYNCLKIELGDAIGENWWCVLYPKLCITDLSLDTNSKELLQSNISSESYEIITSNISYKFKIIEVIESIKHSIFYQNI